MCFISTWGVGARRAVVLWAAMEINLLLLLPRLVFNSGAFRGPRGLKLFFIQRLRGLFLLLLVVEVLVTDVKFTREVIRGLLLLKMGGFPFHQWLIGLGPKLTWESLTVVLTLQKIIPLHFFSHVRGARVVLLRNTAWLVLALRRGLVRKPKKIFLLSSIFFLAALVLIPILAGANWKKLLVVYLAMFASLTFLGGGEKGNLVSEASGGDWGRKAMWVSLILVIRGAPPFIGFFLKLEIISVLWTLGEGLTALRFLVGRAIFLYIYVTLLLWLVVKNQKATGVGEKKTRGRPLLIIWALRGVFLFF